MKFSVAIDEYVADMRAQGRINSPATDRTYRSILNRHGDEIANRDPRTVGREDVKRTLRQWPNPNSQRIARAILVSFYDWAMEEGHRKDNPARQTRRPKKRPTTVYRLTRDEVARMLAAAQPGREQRAIYLGICAGLRNAELRGLRGEHFARDGFLHVSADIAKGGRERWVPIIASLAPIVAEIRQHVAPDEYVLPAMRWRNPPLNTIRVDLALRPSSSQALRTLVMGVAQRAGIRAHVHPHLMRHAFGDHIARFAGIKNAQALLGHASVGTTETYVGQPTLDELAAAVEGFGFAAANPTATRSTETPTRAAEGQTALAGFASAELPPDERAGMPEKAPTRIELVKRASRLASEDLDSWLTDWLAPLEPTIALYREAFS